MRDIGEGECVGKNKEGERRLKRRTYWGKKKEKRRKGVEHKDECSV